MIFLKEIVPICINSNLFVGDAFGLGKKKIPQMNRSLAEDVYETIGIINLND